ncbi:MAG: L-threonylcarbamoyladenylate synthase [Oscillospiraceae bacterium]|nr:L-threonylcarbamoyladenylate synthase [Oscillospiraceae bacterium]
MQTLFLVADSGGIRTTAKLLRSGEIVAIPTETVYGLACNALNPEAIEKVFKVKGRPSNNPLIVHVSGLEMAGKLGLEIPPIAEILSERFWPGPLTMIFKKNKDTIPPEVSCGLDTVAVRVPSHPAALEIIKLCRFPLAAPSANISGSPSPTKSEHVYDDLKDKIPLILDGGECEGGIESTVVMFETIESSEISQRIRILRPGGVTAEQLGEFAETVIDDAVCAEYNGENPSSPGTAHKHYSPKAQVIAVVAENQEKFINYINANKKKGDFILSFTEDINENARLLFSMLRDLDEMGAKRIFARLPEPEGLGLAVYNRLIRAAEFNSVKAE